MQFMGTLSRKFLITILVNAVGQTLLSLSKSTRAGSACLLAEISEDCNCRKRSNIIKSPLYVSES